MTYFQTPGQMTNYIDNYQGVLTIRGRIAFDHGVKVAELEDHRFQMWLESQPESTASRSKLYESYLKTKSHD